MISRVKINTLKEKHQKEMENYSNQINEYIEKHGNDGCEYLQHRISMSNYHRGAYNVLIMLEKM